MDGLSVQLMALAMHRVRFRLQVLQKVRAGRQRCHVYLWHRSTMSVKMIWVPPVSIMKTYYEMSKYDNGQFTENQKHQCAAGEETQAKINSKDCPFHDAFCNRYQRIDEIDLDNDNYNQFCCTRRLQNLAK